MAHIFSVGKIHLKLDLARITYLFRHVLHLFIFLLPLEDVVDLPVDVGEGLHLQEPEAPAGGGAEGVPAQHHRLLHLDPPQQ